MTKEQAKEMVSGSMIDSFASAQAPSYIFRPGDIVKIDIPEYSDFDTTVTIAPTGSIEFKIIGKLQVAGLTRSQLATQLVSRLSEYIRLPLHPSITIVNTLTQKVVVIGAVTRQDNFPVSSDMSLLQILAIAGGPTENADVQHIRIIRGDSKHSIVEVDLTQMLEEGTSAEIPTVKPGDVVFVPKEENIIRELSNFFRDAIFIFSFFAVTK